MQFLGIDLGSSSVKVAVIDAATGEPVTQAQFPEYEMEIISEQPDRAEQEPELWFSYLKKAIKTALSADGVSGENIGAIGISYQMHGLVLVDKQQKVIRPSIIWCDSRAVETGDKAEKDLGEKWVLTHLLNSPGNFTASKLKWVKENEPELYDRIYKFMLPGDYIAMRLSGKITTTITGLSEGIFWDFDKNEISTELLQYYGFNPDMIPDIVDGFGTQVVLSEELASELGLKAGTPVTYRAGDQPNNAFSLNVLNPGEVAATAGTSGVVYAVADKKVYDLKSRVNVFAHVNHTKEISRLGVLLCVNGTGIQYAWLRRLMGTDRFSYPALNELAESAQPGSEGVLCFPFGNGAERMLGNVNPGARITNINFNIHQDKHIVRAALEGVAFSFWYGMKVINEMGIHTNIIRAGMANLFQSSVFAKTLATMCDAEIELYNTDGAIGAARGAGLGLGFYSSEDEAFKGLKKVLSVMPESNWKNNLSENYDKWENHLMNIISE
ncbi:MAG: carbohydrate kinase [Chlorobi bacterium]|nr:carbohydrate kinase [Chlorobiota bacterium]